MILDKINNRFNDYSKDQILQALQIYISGLSQQCNQILVLLFNTDKNYKQIELATEVNCSQANIYKCVKKITNRLERKSLMEELSLILSQITTEIKVTKIASVTEEEISDTGQSIFESDNKLLTINLVQLRENVLKNQYFNNLIFEQMLSQCSGEIQNIVILKLNNYSLDEIYKLFNMKYSELEIINIIKNVLISYKNMINNYIDSSIELITDKSI